MDSSFSRPWVTKAARCRDGAPDDRLSFGANILCTMEIREDTPVGTPVARVSLSVC